MTFNHHYAGSNPVGLKNSSITGMFINKDIGKINGNGNGNGSGNGSGSGNGNENE